MGLKKDTEVIYIDEPCGFVPVYDLTEGKSWQFNKNYWRFAKSGRVLLNIQKAEKIENVVGIIEDSTAFLPSVNGYIIAFLYRYQYEIGVGLAFVEGALRDKELYPPPKEFSGYLPSTIRRQPYIKYSKKKFFEIRARKLFNDLNDFRLIGNRASFRYAGCLFSRPLSFLADDVSIELGNDEFIISYRVKPMKSYDSRSAK